MNNESAKRVWVVAWLLVLLAGGGRDEARAWATRLERLREARNWAYQIQGIDAGGAVDALAGAGYDVAVIEPTRTEKGSEDFPTREIVTRLKGSAGSTAGSKKIVLAYVCIGEAEDWRGYWSANWRAPTATSPGSPSFLVAADPDQWAGCYPVAFWDAAWQGIVATGTDSVLSKILDDGFDGIYMDWVEAYACPEVTTAAARAGKNPGNEMVDFVRRIRMLARQRDAEFLIVPQNASELGRCADYLALCDALAQEDVFFSGQAEAAWGNPAAGDVRTPDTGEWSRASFYKVLGTWLAAGKPVFQVSYALQANHIIEAYQLGLAQGYIMFVSQTPLDRLPPWRQPPPYPPFRRNGTAAWQNYE